MSRTMEDATEGGGQVGEEKRLEGSSRETERVANGGKLRKR